MSPVAPTTLAGHPRPLSSVRAASSRSVNAGPSQATFWRRRLTLLAVLVLLAFVLTVAIGRVTADADLASQVAGHVVVEPGQTLWDIAVATAPDGMDVRQQLAAIEDLNGLRAHQVEAWSVVLLPAR